MLNFLSHGDSAAHFEKHLSLMTVTRITQRLFPSNSSISTFTGTESEGYHKVFVVHVFHGHPITTEHLPCAVSAGHLAMYFMVVTYNAAEKCYSIRK